MSLPCPKGCVRAARRSRSGSLSFHSHAGHGRALQKSAQEVAVPAGFRAEYGAMVALTPFPQAPPVLEFYDDLHGAGGMFIPGDWAILVGVADMRRIAADVVRMSGRRVAEIMAGSTGRRPTVQEVLDFTAEAATRRCMAHELGHALLFRGAPNPYAPDEEAGADYYAGRLDAARDKNPELGAMFFHAIGCVGPTCDHPPPDVRAAAYWAGYSDKRNGR